MSKLRKEYGRDAKPADFFMGIDQSYTGFAVTCLVPEQHGLVGHLPHYFTRVYELTGKDADRLWDAQQIVAELRNGARHTIGMEGYAHGAKFNREMAGELGGAVKLALRPAKPVIVSPSALKKYATGKGNASKDQIMLAVYKKWGVEFDDNNAADSYVVARIVSGHATTDYQREVLASLGIITS